MNTDNDLKHLFFFLVFLFALGFSYSLLHAQAPISTTVFPEAFERDDFPFAAPIANTPTAFKTALTTRSSFAIVYRNGVLMRPCGVPSGPCDYTPSGNVTATFPANVIQAGDLVTVFFYR